MAIDVALSDSRNAIARIYQQTLPRLRELPGSDVGSWIDAAVELKLELDHVAEHFHQASLELHKLTLELQDREGS
ncbi:MAG TPA: hypothetical protein VFS62_12025 [Chloroflexota bacterium]|nr:hypothetical protein [Chloroflexota bacterium]